MKSTELRIGNYLQDAKGKLAPVEGLSKNKIKAYSGMVTEMPLKPIPLTEEWLLRFGFNLKSKKDGTRGVYSNGKMNFILSNSGNVYTMRNKLIPYVHTFQNHYYYSILDEEELTLNK